MVKPDDIAAVAADLLASEVVQITPVERGGNNQLFKIETADAVYALKNYRQDTEDPRDRYQTEIDATTFMQDKSVLNIPQLIAADDARKIAIFQWIEGTHIAAPNEQQIDQAINFIGALQSLKDEAKTKANFNQASEACLSIQEIIDQTKARRVKLSASNDENLRAFLIDDVGPALQQMEKWAKEQAQYSEISYDGKLDPADQILSPSDFGFHNALETAEGEIYFLDFEYFGWDDPTKLWADFILHPGMDLDDGAIECFLARSIHLFGDFPKFIQKLSIVIPLYALRWCTILLNKYLHYDDQIEPDVLAEQLNKARAMLDKCFKHQQDFSG